LIISLEKFFFHSRKYFVNQFYSFYLGWLILEFYKLKFDQYFLGL